MNDNNDVPVGNVEEILLPEIYLARKKKLTSIFEVQNELPLYARDEINDLVQYCLTTLERKVHNLICGSVPTRYLLNANRDTKEEVEKAIRLFPDVISTEARIHWSDNENDVTFEYPIHALLSINVENYNTFKNESFLSLFVLLAMELGQFDQEERGGLLVRCANNKVGNINILHRLVINYLGTDNAFILRVMKQLKELGYLKKEDINDHQLLFYMCGQFDRPFMESVFQFLVDWDPTALTEVDYFGCTPLFYTPRSYIECFQSVFEAGIRCFPKKKGISLLFLKTNHGVASTAFEHACENFGSDNVIDVIEKSLTDYYTSNVDGNDDGNDNKLYNTVDIVLSTAIDENLSLDGVYFLLRREPDNLQKMLSLSITSSTTNTALVTGPNHNTNNKSNSSSDGDHNSSSLMRSTIDLRKRKRE